MSHVHSFPPVVRGDCRLLVLGSLPGVASLNAGRYYAHPRNLFWKLMSSLLEMDFEAQPYDVRLKLLQEAGVGLWDVIAGAFRPGSLDAVIRNPEPNELATLVSKLPALRAIGFNGAKAYQLGSRPLSPAKIALVALPSSSPANARLSWPEKQARWMALRPFLA